MYFTIWTNTFSNLDKYILQLRQIHSVLVQRGKEGRPNTRLGDGWPQPGFWIHWISDHSRDSRPEVMAWCQRVFWLWGVIFSIFNTGQLLIWISNRLMNNTNTLNIRKETTFRKWWSDAGKLSVFWVFLLSLARSMPGVGYLSTTILFLTKSMNNLNKFPKTHSSLSIL